MLMFGLTAGTENGGLGWPTPTDGPQLTKTYISRFQWNVVLSEYLFLILMSVALGTTKLSLLFFFRRLFVTGLHNVWNRVSIVLIAIVAMFTLAFSLGYVFVCGSNPSAFWSPNNVRATQCLPITGGLAMFEKASFVTDFILDVACILLPFPIVRATATDCIDVLNLTDAPPGLGTSPPAPFEAHRGGSLLGRNYDRRCQYSSASHLGPDSGHRQR